MPKISVIVPVYNTGRYLQKCFNSILSQEMQDFEIIVINDGSTDNSQELIMQYVEGYPNKIKYFQKENSGISSARNFGVEKATGDYLCFVDSDDYIDENLFVNLEEYLYKADLIKYKCIKVNQEGKELERVSGPVFEAKTGKEAFKELYASDVLIDVVWLFMYKRSFFIENGFEFPENKYHEDWALVPYSIIMAKSVVSTDVYGYYYVQSCNSITRDNDDEKKYKRVLDMLDHYDNLIEKISNSDISSEVIECFKTYMSNCLILRVEEVTGKYQKQYIKEIKKRKITDNIKANNIKQFIKKILLKINVKLYLKVR